MSTSIIFANAQLNAEMMAVFTSLLLRFDGSFRGGCGGAGAVILANDGKTPGTVLWEGGRFLPRCVSSAAAEYEGLLLGLAAAHHLQPSSLHVQGDCRVVLSQFDGRAKSRKLSKLHARAKERLARLRVPSLTSELLPRADNGHADALSRAVIEGMVDLQAGAILGTARQGRRRHALELLESAGRDGVPRAASLVEALLTCAHEASDWAVLLSMYAEAEAGSTRGGASTSARSRALAIEALEALEPRTGTSAGRQLTELRRRQADTQKRGQRLAAVAAHAALVPDDCEAAAANAADTAHAQMRKPRRDRAAAADHWRTALEREAGGPEALQGEATAADSVPRLLALVEQLKSAEGIGVNMGG